MRRDDYSVFCDKFKPHMENNNEFDEGIKMYETFDPRVKEYTSEYIWTLVDCEGKMYIIPGWHYVNRMNYIITEIPWKEGQRDYKY